MSWLEHGICVRVVATGELGTRLPLLGDAHVHLGLTDLTRLLAGGIGRVLELGWIPEVAARWRVDARADAAAGGNVFPEVSIAGAFLAPVGGYPVDREWAPVGAVREVLGVEDAIPAVAQQVAVGASVIKVTLNSDAGPVFDDATLAAIVAAAQTARLSVVAHAEGAGQCARAIAAHVEVLAHTPFTETIPDALIERAIAQGQQWISTLDIHGYGTPDARETRARAIADDNLRRFVSRGGTVLYGTDLGNGKLPIGINAREVRGLLAVGLTDDDIIDAMTRWWGAPCPQAERVTFVPGAGAADNFAGAADFADWLAQARVMNADELEKL